MALWSSGNDAGLSIRKSEFNSRQGHQGGEVATTYSTALWSNGDDAGLSRRTPGFDSRQGHCLAPEVHLARTPPWYGGGPGSIPGRGSEVTSHGVEVMATNRFPSPEERVRFLPALLRKKQEDELVAKLERRLVATQEIPGSSPGGLSP